MMLEHGGSHFRSALLCRTSRDVLEIQAVPNGLELAASKRVRSNNNARWICGMVLLGRCRCGVSAGPSDLTLFNHDQPTRHLLDSILDCPSGWSSFFSCWSCWLLSFFDIVTKAERCAEHYTSGSRGATVECMIVIAFWCILKEGTTSLLLVHITLVLSLILSHILHHITSYHLHIYTHCTFICVIMCNTHLICAKGSRYTEGIIR